MAIAKNNLILTNVSGTIGEQLTLMQRAGKTILSKAKKKKGKNYKFTQSQLDVQEKFADATAYANSVKADPDMTAAYLAVAKPGQNAHNLAIRDFYNAPEIHHITAEGYNGKAGQQLVVRATDDFRVYRVTVTIISAEGELIEEGSAILGRNGVDWYYTTKVDHPGFKGSIVRAMAEDLPGNKTAVEGVL